MRKSAAPVSQTGLSNEDLAAIVSESLPGFEVAPALKSFADAAPAADAIAPEFGKPASVPDGRGIDPMIAVRVKPIDGSTGSARSVIIDSRTRSVRSVQG